MFGLAVFLGSRPIIGAGSWRRRRRRKAADARPWDEVVAAAKKEGVVVWSFFGAPGAATERQSREFERLYGIRVELSPGRTGDFEARWNAERAAGKPSIDVRSSGSPENRRLAARGLDQSFGTLPALQEAGVQWIVDPLVDVKAGNGHTLHFTAGGYFLLVNNKLVPPEMGPRSYKDLEDPKYKGLIVLSEPIGPSPGSRWAAYAWRAYGDEHLKKVIANVKALTRAEIDAPKQIARGEYGIFIHPTQVGAADIWKLPKPHPFRLVVPEDGVMLLIGGDQPAAGRAPPERRPGVHELPADQAGAADPAPTTRAGPSSGETSSRRCRSWRTSRRRSRSRTTRTPTSSARSSSSSGRRRPSPT